MEEQCPLSESYGDPKTLWRHKDYPLITFLSPQEAMAAEDRLKAETICCLVVPTPRELGEGCGLSIRIFPGDVERCRSVLGKGSIKAQFFTWNGQTAHWREIFEAPFAGAEKMLE
ncbi:hypothetical protein HM1_2543 [Heliomicrobium modesticaldum Ice1]|uniref:Putative Se/S carrier protein-like domain-containing protein n=1 Tax=Heliobacterium modesticaldum (strain ATCC 51547 / Ice1) TaxID=498761 RepID=B0TAW9_HELMI|nr:DUF3343 domain-containing protein [Heliomicrobium modesticaldum]ABZ85080.1 hypothetical protein HM1_2543 [Heliomicrobium modesticaldum Ice1]